MSSAWYLQDRQPEEDAFNAAKRAAGCAAIVMTMESVTLVVVEMDEATVDGLCDGTGVVSATEVDG